MPYYVIGSKIKVMKISFLSPFPKGLEEVNNEKIAQSLRDASQANAFLLILFTDLGKAQEFARKFSENYDTVAAYYIDYAPVIEVTLNNEALIQNNPTSLRVGAGDEKITPFTNIEKVNGYYYQQGSHIAPRATLVTLEKPLTLQELSQPSESNSCVIS